MNINQLANLTEKIKLIITQLGLKNNDVRKAYFENLYSIIGEFYHGKVFFRICQEIKEGNVKFDASIYELRPHVDRLYQIVNHDMLTQGYLNDINRKLYVDTFTNFEATISLCFDNVIDEKTYDEIVRSMNSKLISICKSLDDNAKEKLITELKKNTFIPLIRKFKYLARLKNACYNRDFDDDLKFLEFSTKLRNCVSHSAGYYKGKDYQYEFENIKFIFKNDTFLEMIGENNNVFLQINERLSNIIYSLFNCLSDVEFIQYPDDGF